MNFSIRELFTFHSKTLTARTWIIPPCPTNVKMLDLLSECMAPGMCLEQSTSKIQS